MTHPTIQTNTSMNQSPCHSAPPEIPDYLKTVYWWAYLHPNAVRLFEREWLINLILWGNFRSLRDKALIELGQPIHGKTLQIACVYGDFTPTLVSQLAPEATLDIVDVAPIQLANLARKLPLDPRIQLHQQDACRLQSTSHHYDHTVLFFLLHEQPEPVRRATLREALRVTRPGGRIVIIDYHRPSPLNPLRYVMNPVLRWLEPFALDLWQHPVAEFLPATADYVIEDQQTYFGGLYQKVVIQKR